MVLQIVQKKTPFRNAPWLLLHPVKAGRKRRDPIESSSEIRQRLECFDLPRFALDSKQVEQIGKYREPFQIKPQTAVALFLADVEKKAAPAAEIQHLLWRQTMQPKILHSLDVQLHIPLHVRVFCDLHRGMCIAVLNLADAVGVKPGKQRPYPNRMN